MLEGAQPWHSPAVAGCAVGYIVSETVETLVCGTHCTCDGRRQGGQQAQDRGNQSAQGIGKENEVCGSDRSGWQVISSGDGGLSGVVIRVCPQ